VLVHVDPLQAPDDLRLLGLDIADDLEPEMNRVRIIRNDPFRFDSWLL